MTTSTRSRLLALLAGALLAGCASGPEQPPLRPIDRRVDLPRFMGAWYVLAHIPTFIEDEAHNAVESYALADDGTIPTTYTFNNGSLDGPLKTYNPRGFVHNRETNAEWRMQFIWPFKAAYLIVYLDADYQTTIIGVPDRDYAWIMARTKTLPEARYQELVDFLAKTGHDTSKLRRVPHR
jgi:apolipoprotein D and lipocalin family protein